jgi:hypothetical protein
VSIIEQAREAGQQASDARRDSARKAQAKTHADGEALLRSHLVTQRFGPNPDAPYDGEVKRTGTCRYRVDDVDFAAKYGQYGHLEVGVVLTCPLCGSQTFHTFTDVKDLGSRLNEVENGEAPFLHNCREGDVANLATTIRRVANRRNVTVAALYDEIGRNL